MALRILARLFWCCLLSTLALGQMPSGYKTNTSNTLVDTFNMCAGASASYCWHSYPTAPTLTNIAVGYNGELWGIATGTLAPVELNRSTQAWTTKASLPL